MTAKGKLIRAWAVVCSGDFGGEIHDLEHGKADAAFAKEHYDSDGGMACSPHRVIELRGEWKPPARKRVKP